jgi:hypothetical protein
MGKKRSRPPARTVEGYAGAIIKELEVVVAHSGQRAYQVFDDWLEAAYHTMVAAPDHIRASAAGLPPPPETPEAAALF